MVRPRVAGGGGTAVEHGFRVLEPKAGAAELAAFLERTDRIATVRSGMRQTLANVTARCEGDGA